MATEAQIEANRRNAAKSTGPRSEEGKQASARNATKLGLFSRHVLLPGEDEQELQTLRDGLRARLQPADAVEELYVERIVCSSWRLQRALGGEAQVYAKWRGYQNINPDRVLAEQGYVGDLDRLQRHIAMLERSIDKALAELGKLQKLRREWSDDQDGENEPNSETSETTTQEVSASAPIEIVKTNPIAGSADSTIRENEANSSVPSCGGSHGGAVGFGCERGAADGDAS